MAELLTSLAAVKDWLGIEGNSSDAELMRLVRAGSAYALSYMNINAFAAQDYVDNVFGNGKTTMQLRNFPIITVANVGVGGTGIAASTMGNNGLNGSGYAISDFHGNVPQSLNLFGYAFGYRQQVQVQYRAGYEAIDEYVIESAPNDEDPPVVVIVPVVFGAEGFAISINPVLIDDVAATLIPYDADSLPSTSEYAVRAEDNAVIFSMADVGKTAKVSYGYVPWDIMQAITQLIGETFRYKDRIGVRSKTLAGQETISYFESVMTPTIAMTFDQYKNVIPSW